MNRDEFIDKLKTQLDQINLEMAKLEKRFKETETEVRSSYETRMKELRGYAEEAEQRMQEARTTAESNWKSLVAEGEKVQNAFFDAYKHFLNQLNK